MHIEHPVLPSNELTAFYEQGADGDYHSTVATTSPWNPNHQHGGPPSALLARAIDQCEPRPDMQISRISIDFLGSIPQGRMAVESRLIRAGRRIELLEAVLDVNGRPAVVARAWRTQTSPLDSPPAVTRQDSPPLPLPDPQPQRYFDGVDPDWGYGRSIEWRFVDGSFHELGPAKVWARLNIPLIAGEPTTGLQQTLIIADSTNGLSGSLPFDDWLYVPPTITLTSYRETLQEWLFLDARTTIGPAGQGLSHADLADREGQFGVATQSLFVQRRATSQKPDPL